MFRVMFRFDGVSRFHVSFRGICFGVFVYLTTSWPAPSVRRLASAVDGSPTSFTSVFLSASSATCFLVKNTINEIKKSIGKYMRGYQLTSVFLNASSATCFFVNNTIKKSNSIGTCGGGGVVCGGVICKKKAKKKKKHMRDGTPWASFSLQPVLLV